MKHRVVGMALFLAAGTAHGQWSDNFNRPDGAMGADWTAVTGTWAVESNRGRHTSTGVNTVLQHNAASLQPTLSVTTLDVFRIPGNTANAFVAVMVGLGGTNTLMVKIQAQTGVDQFSHIGIYRATNGTGWGAYTGGLPFTVLTAQFQSARMTVSFPDASTIRCELDTNFDGIIDQTYNSGAVNTLSLGTQHGVGGWLQNATFDNWSVGPVGPTGACCLTSGASNCVVTTSAGCTSLGGSYSGDGVTCAAANCPPLPTGACCRTDGTCDVVTQNQCTTAGGSYAGNNVTCAAANCPPAGACCFFASCSPLTSAACIAQAGTWQGAASVCGNCPAPWVETGEAGQLPATAQVPIGSGPLPAIIGTLAAGDVDMYQINICNEALFGAVCVAPTAFDTQLFLFNPSGTGVVFNDDAVGTLSRLTSLVVSANGTYLLAISGYDNDALDAGALELWFDTPFAGERAPDGPGAANPVASWSGAGVSGGYTITLAGTCYPGASCYANCDGSTGTPLLTANDFVCFINKYANNDSTANCDGSTGNPLLTANDFVCFIGAYANGCS